MCRHIAQRLKEIVQLRDHRWVVLGDYEIDFVSKSLDRFVVSIKFFGRHELAECVAQLG